MDDDASTCLGEQLVDDTVANTSTTASRATLLADCIQLIEDDNVQAALVALCLVLYTAFSDEFSLNRKTANLLLGVREQLSNILFRSTDILVQNLRAINNLRLPCIEHLADLSCHQGLTRPRRTMKQDTLGSLNSSDGSSC